MGDPAESANNLCHVRAKYPTICVHFIKHDIAQVPKQSRPGGVIGKYPHVEHVGIRQHDAGHGLYVSAFFARSVTVVCGGFQARQAIHVEFAQLVLCKGFGWIDV